VFQRLQAGKPIHGGRGLIAQTLQQARIHLRYNKIYLIFIYQCFMLLY
jgi:hypothetical protein